MGHRARGLDAFEATADGGGLDDADDDGECSWRVEVWIELTELDKLLGLALVDEYSGEFHLDEHGGL